MQLLVQLRRALNKTYYQSKCSNLKMLKMSIGLLLALSVAISVNNNRGDSSSRIFCQN